MSNFSAHFNLRAFVVTGFPAEWLPQDLYVIPTHLMPCLMQMSSSEAFPDYYKIDTLPPLTFFGCIYFTVFVALITCGYVVLFMSLSLLAFLIIRPFIHVSPIQEE